MDESISEHGSKSSPIRALQFALQSPNWITNVLWLTISMLLSSVFVGQIGLFGYGSELIARRAGRPDSPTIDIDSQRLGDYISKGIWPFVVHFLVQLALGVVITIPLLVVIAFALAVGAAIGGDAAAGLSMIVVIPVSVVLSVGAALFSVPFLIHAMVCQDFQKSFDVNWAIGFVRIMAWEMLLSGIIYWLLAVAVCILGMLALCVGYLPALGIVAGGAMHLLSQWYEIYLNRGGKPATPPSSPVIDASIV